ncbi:hypothetical protein L2E82_21204 [Cichorium intybus]|uniref:Uncharacterized protein n=1 Tax=Cichorium intybus TaxID=13427 RepID=A0ACB9DVG6_CICIN|nr:hypothetical protein L2E82_21204 [Cichorium intybus]
MHLSQIQRKIQETEVVGEDTTSLEDEAFNIEASLDRCILRLIASCCNGEERLIEGMKKLEEIFHSDGKAIDELLQIAKTLRAMPVVDLEMPTPCLVGAPNVRKSSLVRLLSTGKPEIRY